MEKQKVSLVLSGGGARGIAHIGVIEELELQGYTITSIAGTSMGALVGGVYAVGKLPELKKWLYTLDKLKVFNLIDLTISGQGFIKGDKVFKKMREFIQDQNIEDLAIPYAVVAVDILENKEVIFTKGSIYDAIRASVAIPTVITPVKKGKKLLIDGGVLNNMPINHVTRTPGDLLIAVDVNADIKVVQPQVSEEEKKSMVDKYHKMIVNFYKQLQGDSREEKEKSLGYFDLINKVIGLMTHRIAMQNMEKNPPDILIRTSRHACTTFDFYMADQLVEMGRAAARDALGRGRETKGQETE